MAKPNVGENQSPPPQTQKAEAKMGRPTLFTQALAEEICERLSKPESMRSICSDDHMPSRGTVAGWMARDATFCAMIMHARELQAEALADEAIAIADDPTGDYVLNKDGVPVPVWESVQRAKLRCDARRWLAAKLAPKRFGEKVTQEHTGEIKRPMLPDEAAALIGSLLDQAERDMGIVSAHGLTNAARFKAILATGEPVSPILYRAMHGEIGPNGPH